MMDQYCTKCGKKLNKKTLVMLELNWKTNEYSDPAKPLASEDSQGLFPFGKDCAKALTSHKTFLTS
jgi:hypothetical protein